MEYETFSSLTDQVSEALIAGIREGRWTDELPGRVALAHEMGVNHKTIERALKALEKTGWLIRQGSGKSRRIARREAASPKKLRVVILGYESYSLTRPDLLTLHHRLQMAGHVASFAGKTMRELGMTVTRIARFVEQTEADAWIVQASPIDVWEWFATRPTPVFALYGGLEQGRHPSAGPNKLEAERELVERLIGLGHRRIVMLVREERRKPKPGVVEQAFLDRLEACNIKTSSYNLPDWGDTPEELHRALDSLFRHTPPTALIIDDIALFFATMQHLAGMGIIAPDQISLACSDSDPNFEWCRPAITHIAWETGPVINRVLNWAANVSRGKDDRRVGHAKAKLVIGGTIGPVPGNK